MKGNERSCFYCKKKFTDDEADDLCYLRVFPLKIDSDAFICEECYNSGEFCMCDYCESIIKIRRLSSIGDDLLCDDCRYEYEAKEDEQEE